MLFLNPIAFLESVGRIDYKTGLAYNNQSMVKKSKVGALLFQQKIGNPYDPKFYLFSALRGLSKLLFGDFFFYTWKVGLSGET